MVSSNALLFPLWLLVLLSVAEAFSVPSENGNTRRDFVQSSLLGVISTFGLQKASHAANEVVYSTANDIPSSAIENHDIIYGYVERVIDGDTIRARHIPNLQAFLKNTKEEPRSSRQPLGNTTIVIRMYGIDAPETAKKKNETSQPFGDDATQFTKDLTYHKIIAIKMLRKDKYNRIVAEVDTFPGMPATPASVFLLSPSGSKDLSQELAARGLATRYTGYGAEYDGKLDLLQQNVEAAQRSKLGIWSLGDDLVTPAEYKKMKKLQELKP